MKILLLALLFLPIIYLAARQKKWYLYLLFAFLTVFPEQMAIDLHEKLPLISTGRLLIVLVFGFWLWDRWKAKRFTLPKSLLIFLGINLIVSFVNFRYGFGEVNRIFLLVFERVLPVLMVADMITSREEFDTCADFLILGASALAIIGIIQTVFNYDITTPLHWVKTMSSVTLSERMGLHRAYGTYNAISFGCYCALVATAILYRLYNTKKIWYSISFALVTVAMICSLSRSAWLCLIAALALMVLFTKGKLIPRCLPATGIMIALILVLMVFQPNLKNAFVETTKSTVNTVLDVLPESMSSSIVRLFTPKSNHSTPEDPDAPEEDAPTRFELDESFGLNGEDPSYSRMAQWTAVQHMAENGNLVFGLGYNALPEGRIHFFFDRWGAEWEPTSFLDVGLVALIAESGLIGAISYMALLGYMLVYSFLKRDKKNPMDFYHIIIYTIPLFLMLNFLAAFMFEDLVWILTAMFYCHKRITAGETADRDDLTLPLGKVPEEHP